MAKCNWDPSKHEGRPCPIHGSGMWDENILTRKDKIEKLKSKGYTQEEIEEELKDEKFDEDDEKDFTYEEESALRILKSVLNDEQWEAIKNNKKYIEGYLSGQFTPRDLKMAAQITLEFQNKSKE